MVLITPGKPEPEKTPVSVVTFCGNCRCCIAAQARQDTKRELESHCQCWSLPERFRCACSWCKASLDLVRFA